MSRILPLVCALLVPTASLQAVTWIVDPSGAGDATTIQDGIDLATYGDTVLVRAGTYADTQVVSTPWGDRVVNVSLKDGVTVEAESGPLQTVIEGGDIAHYNVWAPDDVGADAVLTGFTLTRTQKGIYVDHAQPTLRGNVLLYHSDSAIYLRSASPHIESSTIYGAGERGIFADGYSAPIVRFNVIAFGARYGIHCALSANLTLECNDVFGHVADYYEGPCDPDPSSFSLDPRFCDPRAGGGPESYLLAENSPCLPDNNSCGVRIGALAAGCGPLAIGACCLPDHRCLDVTEGACAATDGDFLGEESVCDTVTCPFATYAVPQDFATIQAAIDFATTGDTIVVAPGVYSGTGNIDLNFRKDIVLRSQQGPDVTVIDCQHAGRGFSVVWATRAARIEGFTVRNGVAPDEYGGAFNCNGTEVEIRDCRLIGNYANEGGGGVHCTAGAEPLIRDCVITGNVARNYGGGGIQSVDGGHPVISGCTISGNYGAFGGGVLLGSIWDGSASIERSIIWGNCAESQWPEVRCFVGHGLAHISCSIIPEGGAGGYGGCVVWGEGNLQDDPLFCEPAACDTLPTLDGDYTLDADSPALGDPECGRIGALGEGCGVPVDVDASSARPASIRVTVAPNPSAGSVMIRIDAPPEDPRRLDIFDVTGRLVRRLDVPGSARSLVWDGKDETRRPLASGLYFVRLSVDDRASRIERFVLVR